MAHGNMSDFVALAIIAIVVQMLAFPNTLYEDLGPLKAQFTEKSKDMDAIIRFAGGLLLMLGLTFSGVRWNPINGKMAALGGFITAAYISYSTYQADSDVFVPRGNRLANNVFIPRLFHVYAAVIFLGALHIGVFPSNPLPPKTPETKNNHGNFSDMAAFPLIACALGGLFYPNHLFNEIGPMKPQFAAKNADLSAMIRLTSCLLLIIALMLSGVKWNPINGKMAGLGGFVVAGHTVMGAYKDDGGAFVPHIFYFYSALIFFGALHIFLFPSNPLPAKAEQKKD